MSKTAHRFLFILLALQMARGATCGGKSLLFCDEAAGHQPMVASRGDTAVALPVESWLLAPGNPDASVGLKGDSIIVRRGPLGRQQYISRAYVDVPVRPGAQYIFYCRARCQGDGFGQVFAYVGDANSWDEKAIVWGERLLSGASESSLLLSISVPATGSRIRLCVSAQGADTTACFSDLGMEMAVAPLILASMPAKDPVIDGNLSDPIWGSAATLGPMRVLGDIRRPASLDTKVKAVVLNGWLWLGIDCQEPDLSRLYVSGQNGLGLSLDDCVEVFVSRDRINYSQIIVNAAGKNAWYRLGKRIQGRTWYPAVEEVSPGVVESAVSVDRVRGVWTCEMRLSTADILGPHVGGRTPLYLNVVRHRPRGAEEYVTWSALPRKTNHEPQFFAPVLIDFPENRSLAFAVESAPRKLTMTSRLEIPDVLLAATPVRIDVGRERFALPGDVQIVDRAGIDSGVIADLRSAMNFAGGPAGSVVLDVRPEKFDDIVLDPRQKKQLEGQEAFFLGLSGNEAVINGRSRVGVLRGMATLMLMASRARDASGDLPALGLWDAPAMAVRGWMLHDSNPIAVTRRAIDAAFCLRLNYLLIAVDSFGGPTGFPFSSAPIGDPRRTKQEWIDAFDYARARGIEPVPYIASWGRVQYLTRLRQYKHLRSGEKDLVENFHNIDVANPESHAVTLALQEELIDALRPSSLCIAFDEIHYGEMVSSPAAQAKGWRASDWVVEALTVNSEFLRRKGVRMWLWGDMLDPGQNGHHLDMSGPALLDRLPRDMVILDWKYGNNFSNQDDYPSFGMFKKRGLETYGCPWFRPVNIAAVAASARRYGADGMIQTSWNCTDPQRIKPELARALSLTARLSWSPGDADLSNLTVVPDAIFAYARSAREGRALGRVSSQCPLMPGSNMVCEADAAALMGWSGASLDFLGGDVRNSRGVILRPFEVSGRPAALMVRGSDASALAVDRRVKALTFLHATTPRQISPEMADNAAMLGNDMGGYTINYANGLRERIPLAYRVNIGAVNDPAIGREMDPVVFGTLGGRYFINLSSCTWVNPFPDIEIRTIELFPSGNPEHKVMLVAATAE